MSSPKFVARLNPKAFAQIHRSLAKSGGISRRSVLAGAASAMLGGSGVVRATTASLGLGGFRIRTAKKRSGGLRKVTVELYRGCSWTLDTAHYAGSPTLRLNQEEKNVRIELKDARLPGSEFAVNLTATITPGILGNRIRFEFPELGLDHAKVSMEAPLEGWLSNRDRAEASLTPSQSTALLGCGELFSGVAIDALGIKKLRYLATGDFASTGTATLHLADDELPIQSIEFGVAERSADTLISGKTKSSTWFKAEPSGDWEHEISIPTEDAWHLHGPCSGMESISIEAHENLGVAIALIGTEGFHATLPNQIAMPTGPIVVAKLVGDQPDFLAFASLKESETWIHRPGLSVLVAPQPDATFSIRTNRQGSLIGKPLMEARRVAPSIEGAIVTFPDGALPLPVSLEPKATSNGIADSPKLFHASAPEREPVEDAQISVATTIFFEVIRPHDLLSLTFQTINLTLNADGKGASLVRQDPAKPCYLMVGFPPQSLIEETIAELAGDSETVLPKSPRWHWPVGTQLSGHTRLVFYVPSGHVQIGLGNVGGLLDWSSWTLSVSGTALSYGPNIKIDPSWVMPIKFQAAPPKTTVGTAIKAAETTKGIGAAVAEKGVVGTKVASQTVRTEAQTKPAQTSGRFHSTGRIVGTNLAKDEFLKFELGTTPTNVNPVLIVSMLMTGRHPVSPGESAIEMPAKMILSPDENAYWFHRLTPDSKTVTNGTRSVLFHTRLGAWADSNSGRQAIWMSDDGRWIYLVRPRPSTDPGARPSGPPAPDVNALSGPRKAISISHPTVRAIDAQDYDAPTDLYPGLAMLASERKEIVDAMTIRSLDHSKDSEPFIVENLMLTALGGYLKGSWKRTQGPQLGVVGWKHTATLGRDHYVKIVTAGFIYPFMHRAVMLEVSERKFQHTMWGLFYAPLRKRIFVVVTQPTVEYDAAITQGMGFSKITCLTSTTPDLDPPKSPTESAKCLWLRSGGHPVQLAVRGTDMNGNLISWNQAVAFVDGNQAVAPNPVTLEKVIPFPESVVGGQMVAFAPDNPGGDRTKPGGTHYPCTGMLFGSVPGTASIPTMTPSFRPTLVRASIKLPAIQMLQSGSTVSGSVAVAWAAPYKQGGFGPGNPSEVFLELIAVHAAKFGDTSKAGGLVQPNMNVGALSRKFGTLPAVPSASSPGSISNDSYRIKSGSSDITSDMYASTEGVGPPSSLLPDAAKLLGAVSLWDILPHTFDVAGNGTTTPRIVTQIVLQGEDLDASDPSRTDTPSTQHGDTPVGVSALLTWAPPLSNLSVFKASNNGKAASLNIYARASQVFKSYTSTSGTDFPSGSSYRCVGIIKNFTIDLDIIAVYFDHISFTAGSGDSVKFELDANVKFQGMLSFVGKLEKFIGGSDDNKIKYPTSLIPGDEYLLASTGGGLLAADDSFSIEPFLDIDGSGITAGLTITIPEIGIGVLDIRNISFLAQIKLPFLGESFEITFQFSSRDNPFALSVYCITGGGFFGLTLASYGMKMLEASLEFGASISIDLGVASGGVSIMAGIYFKLEVASDGSTQETLTGYVRLNGELSVLGIITISVSFYLGLTWCSPNKVAGDASLEVEISILFFHIGVTVSVHKEFAGGGGSAFMPDTYASLTEGGAPEVLPTPFSQSVPQNLWALYCGCFGEN